MCVRFTERSPSARLMLVIALAYALGFQDLVILREKMEGGGEIGRAANV